jgi:hypothetical protein
MTPIVGLLALAANEPWCIPPDRAARLTVDQLTRVVLYPDRDHNGRVDVSRGLSADDLAGLFGAGGAAVDHNRDFFNRWAEANKVPQWRADQLWRERCQAEITS